MVSKCKNLTCLPGFTSGERRPGDTWITELVSRNEIALKYAKIDFTKFGSTEEEVTVDKY